MSTEDAIQFANDRPTSCDEVLYQWAVDAEEVIRNLVADAATRQRQENSLVRILDVALNGEAGAAPQASLCDIASQACAEAVKLKRPLLKSYGNLEADLPDTEDMAHSAVQEALCYGLSHHVIHTWMRAVQDQTIKAMLVSTAPAKGLQKFSALDSINTDEELDAYVEEHIRLALEDAKAVRSGKENSI